MSEDIGAEIREEHFGHILLRTYGGEVLSLDLYETPDLVCRGVYQPVERRGEGNFAGAEVVLVAERDAQEELSRRFTIVGREEDGYFELTSEDKDMMLYGEISSPIEREGRAVWAGALSVEGGPRGESTFFTFLLERWGSIETYQVLMILGYLLVLGGLTLAIVWRICQEQAVEQCGEGNVKASNLSLRLSGRSLDLQTGCQTECFERTSPT
jgi:hypothetical protein